MSKTPKVRYEEMFPDEFEQALARNPIAYLPLGSLEWHGYHNILGLDSIKAWKILEQVAQERGGILFPPLHLGYSLFPDRNFKDYPKEKFDCYHLNAETYEKVLRGYFSRMSRIGVKTVVVLAGHYPNADIARRAAKKHEGGLKIIVGTEVDFADHQKGDHAGKWETSLMMALCPEYVDLDKMKNREDRLDAISGLDPKDSSKDYGFEMLEQIKQGIIRQIGKS